MTRAPSAAAAAAVPTDRAMLTFRMTVPSSIYVYRIDKHKSAWEARSIEGQRLGAPGHQRYRGGTEHGHHHEAEEDVVAGQVQGPPHVLGDVRRYGGPAAPEDEAGGVDGARQPSGECRGRVGEPGRERDVGDRAE